MTVKGIEVSGTIYDNEDETARNTATSAAQTAATASQTATTAQSTAETAQSTAETAQSTAETADEKIGTLANLNTTEKTDVVSAINEIVTKVQSRPIITVETYTSSTGESRLTPSDVISAGFSLPLGSYLVTIYRNTSSSLTYFIGWVWSTNTFDDSYFTKLAGEGTTLLVSGDDLVYNGGDTGPNLEVTWIFQPIGDSHCDN